MAEEEIRHPDGRIEHPGVRSEKTDADFRWVLGLLLGAALLAVIILVAVLGFFHRYNDYQSDRRKSPFPLAPRPSAALPPEPRLEQLDRLRGIETPNVFVRQETKEGVLNSYGTIEEEGYLHVPIERAMQYLAGKLPARPEAAAGRHENGLVDAGESNSGRLFRGRPKWSTK